MQTYNEILVGLDCPVCEKFSLLGIKFYTDCMEEKRYYIGDKINWIENDEYTMRKVKPLPDGKKIVEGDGTCRLCGSAFPVVIVAENEILTEIRADFMDYDLLIERYGICPDEHYEEIKCLLQDEIREAQGTIYGCGEYLRLLCCMIYYFGRVEDCEMIWEAKRLNQDTFFMIDIGLASGGGYQETLDYLEDKPHLAEMEKYIMKCFECEDEFERDAIVAEFCRYYGSR